MPKTFPVRLDVEEIALGTVLRKLNDMPGIVGLHLDLGHGGQGAGRKELENHAAAKMSNGGSAEQQVIKLLLDGPKHIREISQHLGGKKPRAYGAVHQLKKKSLIEAGPEKGTHQLTHRARTQLGVVQALPAPAKVARGPKGRATPGSGNVVLKTILKEGPKSPVEIRAKAKELGMSPKSISGVMDRAKRDSLIKKNGAGYELTAKGQKIETPAEASHG